jgi:hypothetical protein
MILAERETTNTGKEEVLTKMVHKQRLHPNRRGSPECGKG